MDVEIAGPGTFAVNVVGESRYQAVLETAADAGAIVDAALILEDDNPHDDQAVAITVAGQRCGYLSRADARRFRAALTQAGAPRAEVRCKARITGGFATNTGARAHFGLKLDLPDFTS